MTTKHRRIVVRDSTGRQPQPCCPHGPHHHDDLGCRDCDCLQSAYDYDFWRSVGHAWWVDG